MHTAAPYAPGGLRSATDGPGIGDCARPSGGERSTLGVPGRDAGGGWTTMSALATPASVVSRPSAPPARTPASATVSIGALRRSAYPDLTRLFDVLSLGR
jgi:hypothetical protein